MRDGELVKKHFESLLRDGDAANIPRDVLGRLVLQELTKLWLESRPVEDVAAELRFAIENLDPEHDFEFMRP